MALTELMALLQDGAILPAVALVEGDEVERGVAALAVGPAHDVDDPGAPGRRSALGRRKGRQRARGVRTTRRRRPPRA